MLQPLWESRDRYEELKQRDDAVKEVSWPAAGAGVRGARTARPHNPGDPPDASACAPRRRGASPRGTHGVERTEPRAESVPRGRDCPREVQSVTAPRLPASPQSGALAPCRPLTSSWG